MTETHFSLFYGLRFSEVFIWLRVNVKEENIILHRDSFIRKWLQTPDLNLVIALQLDSQTFFLPQKESKCKTLGNGVRVVYPLQNSVIQCLQRVNWQVILEQVRKGLEPGFPEWWFCHNAGISNGRENQRLSKTHVISSIRPSLQMKWPVSRSAQRNYPTATSLPTERCVIVELYCIRAFISMYYFWEGNLGITYSFKLLTPFL